MSTDARMQKQMLTTYMYVTYILTFILTHRHGYTDTHKLPHMFHGAREGDLKGV